MSGMGHTAYASRITYIDAISAMLAKTIEYPAQQKRYPHTSPEVPPSIKPNKVEASSISHVLMSVQAKPSVEMNRKFRCMLSTPVVKDCVDPTHIQDLRFTKSAHVIFILYCPGVLAPQSHFKGLLAIMIATDDHAGLVDRHAEV